MTGIDNQMMFEQARDAIETLIKSYQANRFRVVTEQKESSGASEHKGIKRSIQIFYESGSFPDGTSSKRENTHDVTFQIEYTATAAAKVDLTVLNDPESTESEIIAAFSASQTAGFTANRSIDELRRMIFQILLDPVNVDKDLGLNPSGGPPHVLTQIRLKNFRKNAPIARGKIFVLTASEQLTCQVQETASGATPIAPNAETFDIKHKFTTTTDADDVTPAELGAEVDATP